MSDFLANYMIFNVVYYTVINILLLLLGGDDKNMTVPVWVTLIVAIVPALITALTTLYISRKSQIGKNTSTVIELKEQHKKDFEMLTDNLQDSLDDLSDDIGRVGGKSLSEQHNDILLLIKDRAKEQMNTISEINERGKRELAQKEEREKHLSPELIEIKSVVDTLAKMERNLEEQNNRCVNQEAKINELKAEINRLQSDNDDLKRKLEESNFDTYNNNQGRGRI